MINHEEVIRNFNGDVVGIGSYVESIFDPKEKQAVLIELGKLHPEIRNNLLAPFKAQKDNPFPK